MTIIRLIGVENAVGLVVRVKNTAIEIDAREVERAQCFDSNVDGSKEPYYPVKAVHSEAPAVPVCPDCGHTPFERAQAPGPLKSDGAT